MSFREARDARNPSPLGEGRAQEQSRYVRPESRPVDTQPVSRPISVRPRGDKKNFVPSRGNVRTPVSITPRTPHAARLSPSVRASFARTATSSDPNTESSRTATRSNSTPPVSSRDTRTPSSSFSDSSSASSRAVIAPKQPVPASSNVRVRSPQPSRVRSPSRLGSPPRSSPTLPGMQRAAVPKSALTLARAGSVPSKAGETITPQSTDSRASVSRDSPASPSTEVRSAVRVQQSPPLVRHYTAPETGRPIVAKLAKPPLKRHTTMSSPPNGTLAQMQERKTPLSSTPRIGTPMSSGKAPIHPFTSVDARISTPKLDASPANETMALSPINISADISDAKRERRVLDLEISNKSLLAINTTLEAAKVKQSKEIRALQRRLLRGGYSNASALDTLESLDLSDDDNEIARADAPAGSERESGSVHGLQSLHSQMLDTIARQEANLDESHVRCRHMIGFMLEEARSSVLMRVDADAESRSKVLHPSELEEMSGYDLLAAPKADDSSSLSRDTSVPSASFSGTMGSGDSFADSSATAQLLSEDEMRKKEDATRDSTEIPDISVD